MKSFGKIACGCLVVLGLSACTDNYDPTQRTVAGGLLGATGGGLVGALAGGGTGAAIGAGTGALLGGGLGYITTPRPPAYASPYVGQGYQPPLSPYGQRTY